MRKGRRVGEREREGANEEGKEGGTVVTHKCCHFIIFHEFASFSKFGVFWFSPV